MIQRPMQPCSAVVPCRCGEIELGDGERYYVARIGFGPRGDAMRDAIARVLGDGDTTVRFGAAVDLFELAMGVFYSEDRIEALLDQGAFGGEHLMPLIAAVTGAAVQPPSEADATPSQCDGDGEKKNGAAVS